MPKPSLELPKIPAAAVMELRSEDALETAAASTDSYAHILAGAWLARGALIASWTSEWSDPAAEAFNTGIKIAQVIGANYDDRPGNGIYEVVTSNAQIVMLDKKIHNSAKFDKYTSDLSTLLEKQSPGIMTMYESIARLHTEDGDSLDMAKRGAAALHSIVHTIDVFSTDIQTNRPFNAVGHLVEVPDIGSVRLPEVRTTGFAKSTGHLSLVP